MPNKESGKGPDEKLMSMDKRSRVERSSGALKREPRGDILLLWWQMSPAGMRKPGCFCRLDGTKMRPCGKVETSISNGRVVEEKQEASAISVGGVLIMFRIPRDFRPFFLRIRRGQVYETAVDHDIALLRRVSSEEAAG